MNPSEHCPEPALETGDERHGFRVERVEPVPEVRATAYRLTHLGTGLQVLHLHCEERENLFCLVLRTPPPDSTGVAHILEHAVLAGSQRYPLRDVFNELRRGSLATFVNAFTGPDFTCYPAASQIRADFFNLVEVYTDLVLRPLLTRNTFLREGHHLELDSAGDLTISGIVYNEMKGAFSTPDRIGEATTVQSLFPGSPYGVESGGHPEAIPDLTYEDFREFHRRFYSPSNARVFICGDIPTVEHLAFLARRLEEFAPVAVDSSIPDAARWREPRVVEAPYPVGADDGLEGRTTVNIAWLTAAAGDMEQRLALEVLQQALVGHPAAPLRKALIDSGLGQDLSPNTGLRTWYKEMPFSVGLRGTEPERAGRIEELTLATLERLATEGISTEVLEAALHQVEFRGLEIARDPMPFSLTLMFRALSTWLYDGDPLYPLTFPTRMRELRTRWQAEPDLFARATERWLAGNRHRVRASIVPSRTLAAEREKAVRERLQQRRRAMRDEELAQVESDAAALRAEQQEKTSREALACLPRLDLREIPADVETIPAQTRTESGVTVHEHDIFSNGIAYLEIAFDVGDVDEELQPYLPLLGEAAAGMGAAGLGYEAFATRKALLTGEVSAELIAHPGLGGRRDLQMLVLHASALRRNAAAMVGILADIVTAGDLDDTARLRDILAEAHNSLRASVAPRGHLFAMKSAAAALSDAAWRDEQWHGAPQIRFLAGLKKSLDGEAAPIRDRLARLRAHVLRRDRMRINVTGEADLLRDLREPLAQLIEAVPPGGAAGTPVKPKRAAGSRGVSIPGDVCYAARVLPVDAYGSKWAPLLYVIANHLGMGFLYRKIRLEGGAYGGFGVYAPTVGHFTMASYRDPNLTATLRAFDDAVGAFLEEVPTGEDLRTVIIGALGKHDRPMDPSQKGHVALLRELQGLTDDERRRFRRGVLEADPDRLRACVQEVLTPALGRSSRAVYAPAERLEQANRELAEPLRIETLG